MVKLTFNMRGYAYQEGIRILRTAYQAAETVLSGEIERAKDEAFGYQQSLEQGLPWEGERDEDGHILWDKQTVLDYQVADAEAATQEFRKAFAITIYHTWERSAQQWVGKSKGSHADLIQEVKALGYNLDPRMTDLYCLANLLKHDKISAAKSLIITWPNLFFDHAGAETYGSKAVHLLPRHIKTLLEIAAASGPTTNTPVKTDKGLD